MRKLLLAFAVAGAFAFMAAPAKADDVSFGLSFGRYYDDNYYHRDGHYWHDGSWYRASPYVRYSDPYLGSYYYDDGFYIRYGTPSYYYSTPYRSSYYYTPYRSNYYGRHRHRRHHR